jgi:hypothetical protein
MMSIMEKSTTKQLKVQTLKILFELISTIDQHTMKEVLLKSLEKVRQTESDPEVCMFLLKIYE